MQISNELGEKVINTAGYQISTTASCKIKMWGGRGIKERMSKTKTYN
jgi:hypothetical protein